jgi:hypothetical protein
LARSSKEEEEGAEEEEEEVDEEEAGGCAADEAAVATAVGIDATEAAAGRPEPDDEADDMATNGARCVLDRDAEAAEAERQVLVWSPVDMRCET